MQCIPGEQAQEMGEDDRALHTEEEEEEGEGEEKKKKKKKKKKWKMKPRAKPYTRTAGFLFCLFVLFYPQDSEVGSAASRFNFGWQWKSALIKR